MPHSGSHHFAYGRLATPVRLLETGAVSLLIAYGVVCLILVFSVRDMVARAVGGTYASAAGDRLLVLMFAVPFAAGILLLAAAAAWGV